MIRIAPALLSAVVAFTVAATHHHRVSEPTLALTVSPVAPPANPPAPSTKKGAPRIVETKVGEKARFTSPDTTAGPDVEFAVTKITVDGRCTEQFSEKAGNGHYVFVEISAETAPTMSSVFATGLMNPLDFAVVGPDGITTTGHALATDRTFGCLSHTRQFPVVALAPGRKYTGTIVLDSPVIHGHVVLVPTGGIIEADGWAWQLGEAA
ncbi:hypothetical protein [Amycolatopsis sp.]|uniref:hypothetical protein n=1 Tax=Amycolatopsis sp. TaxID=37632 RepID=UPI002C8C2130|nr:hypothetical protein [Amycolatopsis sp.]HVV10279.1 hypothetical protein [Amycolatopsis sp.]